MKRLILYLLPLALLFSACTKEKSTEFNDNNPGTGGPGTGGPGTGGPGGSGYFLRCKIDGVAKNYSALVLALKMNIPGGGVSCSVSGHLVANGTNFEGMGFEINTNVPLAAGTYSDDAGGTDYALGAAYNPNSQTIVFGNLFTSPTDPFKVVITSLSNTEIAGTFKGTLYQIDVSNPGAPNPPTKVVSEGEFKAKFQ